MNWWERKYGQLIWTETDCARPFLWMDSLIRQLLFFRLMENFLGLSIVLLSPIIIAVIRFNLFQDQIPRKITLGLVANDDYVGKVSTSPFKFQPFSVREISIIANGRSYPQSAYNLDYSNWKAVRPFLDLHQGCGYANTAHGNGISFAKFLLTHCIYVFNLTNSGEDQSNVFDLIRSGTTAVNIKFKDPVDANGYVLIVLGEADSLIFIDKNRSIASDTTI